tara:strand:- start:961 stop:1512 length:552 start_codon:yes stop_codon:yes gene_type:complete
MNKKTRSILLVEDDQVFAGVITRALNKRGFESRHVSSIEETKEIIKDEIFDFAILDLNLGGETSLKLIPVLKKSSIQTRILILTGYASIATAVEAIKLGADNYLAKPADTDEILAAMFADFNKEVEDLDDEIKLETMSVRRLEWEHIQRVLMENNGNVSATARQLNMHRRTLQRKLQKKPVSK